MFKRALFIIGFICMIALEVSLKAAESEKPFPAIFLNPTDFNIGDLKSPEPVMRRIVVKNFGRSLLYISKIKYT
jgi:hypothetical protein